MCEEHAANTCCVLKDINRIIARLNFIQKQEQYNWSEPCLQTTRDMLCTNCDGDIGIGKRRGVCLDLCQNWYQVCKFDYFCDTLDDWSVKGSLDFCTDIEINESKQLRSIVGDGGGELFCKRMGFTVGEHPTCYNGIPKAKTVPLTYRK